MITIFGNKISFVKIPVDKLLINKNWLYRFVLAIVLCLHQKKLKIPNWNFQAFSLQMKAMQIHIRSVKIYYSLHESFYKRPQHYSYYSDITPLFTMRTVLQSWRKCIYSPTFMGLQTSNSAEVKTLQVYVGCEVYLESAS